MVTLQDLAPLAEIERLRAEFLGIVSHELRTPLISIKGSTATVLGASPAADPAEMLQFFRVIDEQADQMRGLISDLLDHGRIVTGTLSVSPEPADVAALVDRARSTFLGGAGNRAVSIDLPEDLPRVMADRARLVQVLNNLISNAARHSPALSPIRVSAARDGVHVAISVTDEGRGVPADRLPHLFAARAAAGSGRARGWPGPGHLQGAGRGARGPHLGRERWGQGAGTRFTFTVPVTEEAAAAAPDRAPARPRPSRKGQERTRILVVDDDPQMLRYVRDALTGAGYTPVVTGEPEDLAGLVRTHRPALVLLDLLLPGIDGIALLERVPELGDLPVIFISAYGRDETVVRALDAGAADYIVKPFSPSELTARVRAALRRRLEPEPFVLGELTIHYDQRRVAGAGRPVELTATEYGAAARALGQRGAGTDVPFAAAPGVGRAAAGRQRPEARPCRRQTPPRQAGRRCDQARLHPQPARRRLSHARAGRSVAHLQACSFRGPALSSIRCAADLPPWFAAPARFTAR